MSDQNWRTETNAGDYFGHQQKQLKIADRRPVIRNATDLVGPGITSNAVRITNFNDVLATFDGYFSADIGATNAPNATDAFVGYVSSDAELGGTQQFSDLTSQVVWTRTFTRSPLDASTIRWSTWKASTDLTARVTFLEGANTALAARVTALEQKVLHTGVLFFFMTNVPPGGTALGDVTFSPTLPATPVCWAIKNGFVTGSSQTIVSSVDNVGVTGCRLTLLNVGSTNATFTDLPIRWFAQVPG